MLRWILLCLSTANAAMAQDIRTDAFGIYMDQVGANSRSDWAGWVETLGPGARAAGQDVPAGQGQTVLFYLGEKSLRAGGATGQAVALVLDGQGNLAPDGTAVTLTTGETRATVYSRFGISAADVQPGQLAGQFHAGAAIAGVQSGRVEYQVHADLGALQLEWQRDSNAQPVMSEDFHVLESAAITDQFNNQVPDGVGGMALLDHGDAQFSMVPMVTVAGRAQGRLLTRDVPGRAQMRLGFGAVTSAVQSLDFKGPVALQVVPVSTQIDPETQAVLLTIGPYLTAAGYQLNDGSPIDLRVVSATGKIATDRGWLMKGMFSATLLLGADAFPMVLRVKSPLGVSVQVLNGPGTSGEAAP